LHVLWLECILASMANQWPKSDFLLFLRVPSDSMWSLMFTVTSAEITDKLMQCSSRQAIKRRQSRGVQDEPWRVFLVSLEEVLTELDRELTETCAEVVECLHLPRLIEDGTERSTKTNADSPSLLLWLPLHPLRWSWLEDTESRKSRRSLWLFRMKPSLKSRKPPPLSNSSRLSMLTPISRRSRNQES